MAILGYPPGHARLATGRIKSQATASEWQLLSPDCSGHGCQCQSHPQIDASLQPEPGLGSSKPGDLKMSTFSSQTDKTPPIWHDTDPSDRGVGRLLARLRLLEDALPLFVLPPQFRGLEFCWPSPSWSPVAYSSARKNSTAGWGRPLPSVISCTSSRREELITGAWMSGYPK